MMVMMNYVIHGHHAHLTEAIAGTYGYIMVRSVSPNFIGSKSGPFWSGP